MWISLIKSPINRIARIVYGINHNLLLACLLIAFVSIYSIGISRIALFDLDELYFAEITREMMRTNNYSRTIFHFEPLYEKPPLFFWIQAASMHLWGINELGARFPNLLCGLLTLLTIYGIGKKQQGTQFGLLWMSLHAAAFLPHFYFKSGIIDPILNYFMLIAIYLLSEETIQTQPSCRRVIAGLSLGCAFLLKGPIGVCIPIAAFILSYLRGYPCSWRSLLVVGLTTIALLSCWLIPEIIHNGSVFIKNFWAYHLWLYQEPVATHNQPWYYHYLVLLFGCFPCSLFTIAFFTNKNQPRSPYFAALLQAVGIIVVAIFTLAGTKIVHYSSMAYFPITFFATHCLCQWMDKKYPIKRWVLIGFLGLGTCIGSCLAILPWLMLHKTLWISLIKQQDIAAALNIPVIWSGIDSIPGILYIVGCWLAAYSLLRAHCKTFIWITIWMNTLALTLFLISIAPKVERYTQGVLIDFCKKYKEEDVYMISLGFKTAAPHFYTCKSAEKGKKEQDLVWLLTGAIDKPCLFIVHQSKLSLLTPYKDIHPIQTAPSCFAFYKRLPPV